MNILGDGYKFSKHILRIFDSDGNGFLDFKEFLLALDIATCTTEQNRLEWIFKLFDVDNDGVIDVQEMASIMETMECLGKSFLGGQKNKQRFLSIILTQMQWSNCKHKKIVILAFMKK